MTQHDDEQEFEGPTLNDIADLYREMAQEAENGKRRNVYVPKTIHEALLAADAQHLEPWMSDNGNWVGFDCPVCKQLGRKSNATIEKTSHGVLSASCAGCNDDIEPGVMTALGAIAPPATIAETNGSAHTSVLEPPPADPIEFGWTDATTPGEPSRGYGLLYAPPNLTRRIVLYGDGETYKTFLAEAIALDVIRTEQRKVVWLDYEGVGRPELISRMLDIGAEREELEGWFGSYNPDEGMSGFAAYVATHNPALVVFDAWIGLAHAEGFISQKDADDAEAIWASAMTHMGAPGRTLLAIDHLNRDKTDWARPGGSIRKRNAVDQAWCAYHAEIEPSTSSDRIKKKLPGRAIITLRRSKGRLFIYPPGEPELSAPVPPTVEITLDFDHKRVQVITKDQFATKTDAAAKPRFRPTHLMERASIVLEERSTPATMNILESDVGGRRDFARIAIDRLLEEGYAGETKGPNRARQIESKNPYREAEDPLSDKFAPSSPQVRPGRTESGFAPVRPPYEVGGDTGGRTHSAEEDDLEEQIEMGEPEPPIH